MPKVPEISVGIFEITPGGRPLISIRIFRPKFAFGLLNFTKRLLALIREFVKAILIGWLGLNVVLFSSGIPTDL